MQFLIDFLKSLLREQSVRAVIAGAFVNGLIALIGMIPNPPAWLTPPLLTLAQQIGVAIELLLAGWAASRVKDVYALLRARLDVSKLKAGF